jgi:hypothetical protein
VAIDPDTEVITAAEVGPATTGDAAMAQALLADLAQAGGGPQPPAAEAGPADQAASATTDQPPADQAPVVYGDAAYGTGACWPTWTRVASRR